MEPQKEEEKGKNNQFGEEGRLQDGYYFPRFSTSTSTYVGSQQASVGRSVGLFISALFLHFFITQSTTQYVQELCWRLAPAHARQDLGTANQSLYNTNVIFQRGNLAPERLSFKSIIDSDGPADDHSLTHSN